MSRSVPYHLPIHTPKVPGRAPQIIPTAPDRASEEEYMARVRERPAARALSPVRRAGIDDPLDIARARAYDAYVKTGTPPVFNPDARQRWQEERETRALERLWNPGEK